MKRQPPPKGGCARGRCSSSKDRVETFGQENSIHKLIRIHWSSSHKEMSEDEELRGLLDVVHNLPLEHNSGTEQELEMMCRIVTLGYGRHNAFFSFFLHSSSFSPNPDYIYILCVCYYSNLPYSNAVCLRGWCDIHMLLNPLPMIVLHCVVDYVCRKRSCTGWKGALMLSLFWSIGTKRKKR